MMLRFKYQLLVDGHGPAYDGNIWKLLSNGVSFQIAPDAEHPSQPTPLYHMFYSPVLRARENYIPTTMSELGESVQWCLDNDEQCSDIAKNARNTVKKVLNLTVVLDYMMRTLTSLHNWHHAYAAS
uniref:Glycosyl transferase CAP10 domain-containing protein n=1 Tax=Dunaliella tertiolecta TaxID=3047 RepID=A0A6S8LC73_DUNTE